VPTPSNVAVGPPSNVRIAREGAVFVQEVRMTEANAHVIAVLWRIMIAALVIAGRLALDRLAFRGTIRRHRRGH
jgi:hypothetical protein